MKSQQDAFHLSASDLVGHLNCRHLTAHDKEVVQGTLSKPLHWDPLLEILRERGRRHEAAFVDHLREQGFNAVLIPGIDISPEALANTLKAMEEGEQIIIQAALQHESWSGRADILRRIDIPSALGEWSYEVIDTKLARETKGGTVLQLCLYADLLEQAQGDPPEYVYVVAPWSDFEPQRFRYADYAAYFQRAKAAIQSAIDKQELQDEYPDPKEHCDICRWQERCDRQRRDDDHLCLVAGVTKNQITELRTNGVATAQALATMPMPMLWKPQRGSLHSYEKAHELARIQIETRQAGELLYELLPFVPQAGLGLLSPPSDGDIFFDIEGDPFVGERGLEYLFGYRYRGPDGQSDYIGDWALDLEGEKAIFERFVDFVTARREEYPDLHLYHYAPYETGALKRLMGRYATREDEIDILLYGKVFVDLYSVVRNALRSGVESYSIKKLEPLYGFTRATELRQANITLASVQAGLELADTTSITEEDRSVVQGYNEDDCISAEALRDWLEDRRTELITSGTEVTRPALGQEGPSEKLSTRQEQINHLIERLTQDVPVDSEKRSPEQQARWILAHLLGWHRRENKAVWWEHFRLAEPTADELIDERAALSRLTLLCAIDKTKTGILTHRYRFEQQDKDLRGDEDLRAVGGDKLGKAIAVSSDERTIDIKKFKATADIHPEAVYAHTVFNMQEQEDALLRLGQHVADHGIEGDGPYRAARALLLNEPPQLSGQPIRVPEESSLQAALRISGLLEGGVFPIQGPPGTGKSFTRARMICQLVSQGRKVGITANSHKVIRNLLDNVLEASAEMGVELCCIQKPKEVEQDQDQLIFTRKNEDVHAVLTNSRCQVAGATHFLWSRADAHEILDVLVVDEAAQMSLANVVAEAQSTKTLILLGDPQQLDQPTQGIHPDGVGVSLLEHVLHGDHTIMADRGLFLEQTWRLHPDIFAFNSELFYGNKLTSREGCMNQKITSTVPLGGSGLQYLSVHHIGNQSSSIEEATAIAGLVNAILASSPRWTDREGKEKSLTMEDIVIITPYNAQVFVIQQRLPGARVGTVDKFQGQEAPIAIYSMATSSYADAPRGIEFLYSANRFNVATSRAKCLAVHVASPDVFEADCKTPRQIALANAFCRYMELASEAEI